MAKWIYERWDTKWDWDKLSEVSTFEMQVSSRTDKFSRPVFSEYNESWTDKTITNRDIFTDATNSQWNSGATSKIYIAISDQTTSWNSSYTRIYASVDVRQTVESDYTKNTMYRFKKKNVLTESEIIAEDGTYPDDGIHTDGYWYVKIKKAFPEIKVVDGTTLKTATSAYVVQDGQLKSVSDIYTVQDGQIKKAK